ncbi:hypothetical protein BP6252_13024 [Coleophoma cylindrospora]|uniref:Xylanolytic transcriptional activator regulatory domain-containing protein n=1 Tax=Coleophoma cylindrospora TaxID=1849047 RepID=A0A3D8QDY1_9HELO|nr:hypothetical protein BP6252_13024 [Coleophoma cylindrospora]
MQAEERNGGNCEYRTVPPATTANNSLSPLQQSSSSAEYGIRHVSSTSNSPESRATRPAFPPVFFLDADLFHRAQLELPLPGLTVPLYVSDLLGGTDSIREMATSFFSDVHPWIPLISKVWFYNHLINPLSPPRADATLLLISIRLITWVPSIFKDPYTPVYLATKQFFRELETAGTLNIRGVQAGVLIALYELGHGIYPAAYVSVGLCARFAVALGFDKDIKRGNITGLPWDKLEERRRVWWAILILDRFMNLGNPSRMLATADPIASDILPADDISWEQGIISSSDPFTIGSLSQLNMGRFARFAQATYHLGQVFKHISQPRDDAFYQQEAIQLNRTLHALVNLSQSEADVRNLEFCTQTAVCYSALLLLEYPPSQNSRDMTLDHQPDDYPVISPEAISRETASMSQNFLPGGSLALVQVSPFILHLLYQTIIILSNVSPGPGSGDDIKSLTILRGALKLLTERWLAAGI